jgi:hypothetical protein
MSDEIKVEVKAADQSATDAFNRLEGKVEKLTAAVRESGRAGAKAGKETADGMRDAEAQAGRFSSAIQAAATHALGMIGVVNQLGKAWEDANARAERARASQVRSAAPVRDARLAFTEDATVKSSEIEGEFRRISQNTGMKVDDVARMAASAFSAGADSNRQALDTVERAAALTPHDVEGSLTNAERSIDLMTMTGTKDPRAALGFMVQAAGATGVKSLPQLGAAMLPAIGSLMQTGDTPEQALETYTAVQQLMKDKGGDKAKTAAIALGAKLDEFAKGDDIGKLRVPKDQIERFKAARSTDERLNAMWDSPELADKFMESAKFETESKAFVSQLVRGTPQARKMRAEAQEKITALDDGQIANYEAKLAELNAGEHSGIARADATFESALESIRLGDSDKARKAQARKMMQAGMEEAGIGYLDRLASEATFDAAVAMGADPVKRGAGELRAHAKGMLANGITASEAEAIPILKQLADLMEKQLAVQKEQANRPINVNVGSDPGRPPGRVPSSGLQRGGY